MEYVRSEGTSPNRRNGNRSNKIVQSTSKQISMERCGEDDFRVCDLAIAPRTLTAVAFPPDVTYLRVEQCVLTAAVSEADVVGSEEEEEVWECLTDLLPAEYYGATVYQGSAANAGSSASALASPSSSWSHWPSSVDIDYSIAAFCEKVTSTLQPPYMVQLLLFLCVLLIDNVLGFPLPLTSPGHAFARFHGPGEVVGSGE